MFAVNTIGVDLAKNVIQVYGVVSDVSTNGTV